MVGIIVRKERRGQRLNNMLCAVVLVKECVHHCVDGDVCDLVDPVKGMCRTIASVGMGIKSKVSTYCAFSLLFVNLPFASFLHPSMLDRLRCKATFHHIVRAYLMQDLQDA